MKRTIQSGLVIVAFVIFLVFGAGCLNLTITQSYTVNKDAQITHAMYNLTMDRSTYNMLRMVAQERGYASVRDLVEANLSNSTGMGNAAYNEAWDIPNSKVTISLERTDTYSPASDSKISIQRSSDNHIIYQDLTFYSPKSLQNLPFGDSMSAPTPQVPQYAPESSGSLSSNSSIPFPTPAVETKWAWNSASGKYEQVAVTPTVAPMLNSSEMQEMTGMMLSGISVDYYLEMPGKIVNTTSQSVNGNKAEWHFGGSDITNTTIYAESEDPIIPGFTSSLAIIGTILAVAYIGVRRNKK